MAIMDLNLLKILIDSDKERKLTAWMLYYFWQNDVENIRTYLESYATKGGMFTTDTVKLLPKTHRDITNKVLNNVCTSYVWGVDRYLVDKDGKPDEKQTELLNDLYKKAGITDAQRDWYKAGKLFNCVEVKVVWRNVTNRAEFDLWTPNFFSVWENAENKYLKDAIIFDITKKDELGNDIEALEFWNKDEHFYMVEEGTFKDGDKMLPIMVKKDLDGNNPDGKNKYKIIPSECLRFKRGEDYFGIGMIDLVEDNIWSDIMRSNKTYVVIFQGMGIVYGVNIGKRGEVAITPNQMLLVEAKEGQEPPFIESVATNAPISEMREDLEKNDTDILTSKGLSGQTASGDNTNAPALSKALDLEERDINARDDKNVLVDFEERLFKVFRTVHNLNGVDKISEDLTFKINVYDKKPTYNVNDLIAKWRFELEIGAKNAVDYVIEQSPETTQEEAEKAVLQNLGEKQDNSDNNQDINLDNNLDETED